MSKGIVKDIPTATSGKIMVLIADDNIYEVGATSDLDFDVDPNAPALDKEDAVEFTITSHTTSSVPKKIACPQGIVQPNPSNRGGESKVTLPDPGGLLKIGDIVQYTYFSPPSYYPQEGDTIQFLYIGNMSSILVKTIKKK